MTYYVIYKNDGTLIGVTNQDASQLGLPDTGYVSFEGNAPDLNKVEWDAENLTFVSTVTPLTRLEFLNRFTTAERIAIRASNDPIVIDIMALLDAASFVDVTDQNTMMGVGYLAMSGIISNSRVAEILG